MKSFRISTVFLLVLVSIVMACWSSANFNLTEGQTQEIVSQANSDGYVRVVNNGPGTVVVLVQNDNGAVEVTIVTSGNACSVHIEEGARVGIRDKQDAADDGTSGTWENFYPAN